MASLSGVAEGHAAKERYEASNAEFDPEMFTAADHAALSGPWGSWLDDGVGPAVEAGPGGLTADVLAYVAPWGADPARITAPTLLLHGGRDRVMPRSHGEWLARRCPSAELWLYPDDGYCSVLNQGAAALTWIKEHADREAEPRAAAEQEGPTVATLEEAP